MHSISLMTSVLSSKRGRPVIIFAASRRNRKQSTGDQHRNNDGDDDDRQSQYGDVDSCIGGDAISRGMGDLVFMRHVGKHGADERAHRRSSESSRRQGTQYDGILRWDLF